MQKLGGCKKDICYKMGTEVFKIKEDMTEKMKPKVGNPPLKIGGIPCSQYFFQSFLLQFCILDEFSGSYGYFSDIRHPVIFFSHIPCSILFQSSMCHWAEGHSGGDWRDFV